jgi:di/tricarboxylate transporter
MCFVLLYMLVALLSDRVGADAVMIVSLTLCMAAGIVTIDEGLEGFSNEGLLSVMALFVVAQGISVTGALDWYMGKLLGTPTTEAGAQLRLMIPISIVSAFINNTPVVVVMIPIVQRWGKNVGISPSQLLIPLSFASILGGTCTLIGTSTNLVVVGLLKDRYPNEDISNIGLFDLGQYGVPVALAGVAYILLVSPFLLPGGKTRTASGEQPLGEEEILLGARLTQWSPAAGRSVKRSGLRDTGGLYLVSVHRAATGNVHRAVGQEFVLNVGDILYFTGLVEEFGDFCEEHGLEVVTNEIEGTIHGNEEETAVQLAGFSKHDVIENEQVLTLANLGPISTVAEHECEGVPDGVPCEVGITKESLAQTDEGERLRTINRLTDKIRGITSNESSEDLPTPKNRKVVVPTKASDPPQIVVTSDSGSQRLVLVGINSRDRPGLLLDISKGLLRLDLQLRHTEAAVIGDRSISIWRCEYLGADLPDIEEIWSVLNALLEVDSGVAAVKTRGLKVIRAVVTKGSRLVGQTATQVDFREKYKSAIVAVQQGGRNTTQALSSIKFTVGDILVLQASDESPLLLRPPQDFYKKDKRDSASSDHGHRRSSSFVSLVTRRFGSQNNLPNAAKDTDDSAQDDMESSVYIGDGNAHPDTDSGDGMDPELQELDTADRDKEGLVVVWRDLRVIFANEDDASRDVGREFLTAMEVSPNSQLAKKTAAQAGISKLPGVYLVSIERPLQKTDKDNKPRVLTVCEVSSAGAASIDTFGNLEPMYVTIEPDEPLASGDVLWFAGSASAVGDLRKIPGLKSAENEEVERINEKVHDRRLVQAVIARKGPLVGKTIKEVRFRTRYGAAVIAVHREGKRIHDHPGSIKLQAGDVLLLEAGPTFIERNKDNDRAFALLAEVDNSAPPRLRFLIPALVIVAAMLIVVTLDFKGSPSLLVCALVAAILMVLLGIMSEKEARDAVNWEVYVTIACAFGIGTALTNSGIAGGVANFLVHVGTAIGIGDAGLLGAVYLATFLISNVVTNNAAAALIFPIAMNAAEQTGTDRLIMSYCVMLAASASFMSPYGYTTNLLVYGPGGYKYKDFLLVGTPMQIVLWILSITLLVSSSLWYLSWIITSVVLILVAALRMTDISSKLFGCGASADSKGARSTVPQIESELSD